MRVPFSFIKSAGGGGPPAYDLADEDLTLFLEAPYGGGTWTGNASAGTSGSHHLTSAGLPPSSGLLLNGHAVADFDGVNDYLVDTVDAWSDIITASTYTIFGLAYFDVALTASGQGYGDALVIGDVNGEYGVVYSSDGIGAYQYPSYTVVSKALATGSWHMFFVTFSAGTMSVSVDGGSPATASRSNISPSLATSLLMGRNYSAGKQVDGKIASLCASKLDLRASEANILARYNSKFALSL